MDKILKDLEKLSAEELLKISFKAKSLSEVKDYFTGIEECKYSVIPSNSVELIKKIEVIDVIEGGDWLCYEEGTSKEITLKIDGIEEEVKLYHKQHSSKHTHTEGITIKIGDKIYKNEHGDFAENYVEKNQDDEYILKKLHDALGIDYEDTSEMVILLFYPYLKYSSFEEYIESLHYLE